MRGKLFSRVVEVSITLKIGDIKSITTPNGHVGSIGNHVGFGRVTIEGNINLSSNQKELLPWHSLGISMPQLQQLMKVIKKRTHQCVMDRVIVPKLHGVEICSISQCESCNIPRAKMKKPTIVKHKAIQSIEGAMSQDTYQVSNVVSMNPYIMEEPG